MASTAPPVRVGDLPLVVLDQVVELDQIDMIDPHALQRPLELGSGCVTVALAGLGCQEDLAPVGGEPWLQPIFGLPIGGGGVDVVDSPAVDDVECCVRPLLTHCSEGSSAEEEAGRLVAGGAERGGGKRLRCHQVAPMVVGSRPGISHARSVTTDWVTTGLRWPPAAHDGKTEE